MSKSRMTECPMCKEKFEIEENLAVGADTYCPECFIALKVVHPDPLTVEVVEDEGLSSDDERDEGCEAQDYQ